MSRNTSTPSTQLQYRFALLLLFGLAHHIRAQQIQFVNVPGTVTEGTDDIAISWTGGTPGTPWSAQLVQDGRVIDGELQDSGDDGLGAQTFGWDVELENTPGGWYSLRIIQGTQTVDSAPINVIDENGVGGTSPPPGSTPTSSPPPNSAPPSASAVSTPADAVGSVSASIAATASTLVTTVISGTTVTAVPDAAAPTGGNNTTDTATETNTGGGGGLSGGAIAGIVIGVLGFLGLIGLLVFCFVRRLRRSRASHHHPTNEKGTRGPTFLTPAAVSGVARSGSDTHKSDIKPELQADNKPLHHQPGMHEMSNPNATAAPASAPYEMYSPDGSRADGDRRVSELSHSTSDASRTVYSGGNRSSVGEMMGSPVDGSHGSVSPQMGQTVPRKAVGGGQGGQPATIHEMG
ncbi:uncharacterized protein AB675_5522 [Cyphellophora attinorum]|uniref:Uncharacterized protein n=1 Tax=Cyphellophora attinorum TaxID=1664694 RepID=A0A0N1HCV2_9EURO|nr:uncharacterized protein AB675_5522 [Phialophora attinorum]KPI41846.1 hypothetical protein AB675_5522 [Phialophora attinorum]